MIDLSFDQKEALSYFRDWFSSESSLMTLGGYAGTGKTTLLGVIGSQDVATTIAFVSYTGRAASILNRKLRAAGVNTTDKLRSNFKMKKPSLVLDDTLPRHGGPPLCSTIHRLLYQPVVDQKTGELHGWTKREELDREYGLIVIDEASMVSDEILADIQRHGVPVLAVGDHGQLPPVSGTGSLMKAPDVRLERIHRQAEGNPIIALAQHVRQGGSLSAFKGWTREVSLAGKGNASGIIRCALADAEDRLAASRLLQGDERITSFSFNKISALDVGVLCWTNRTRVQLNGSARTATGKKGPPRLGEPLICLKNGPPVYNGMRGVLTADSSLSKTQPWILEAHVSFPDEGLTSQGFALCGPQFNRERTFDTVEEFRELGMDVHSMSAGGRLFDFGYCLTVHKSQGSQFADGIVYMDRPEKTYDDDYRRWIYTAVTRASERLTVLK